MRSEYNIVPLAYKLLIIGVGVFLYSNFIYDYTFNFVVPGGFLGAYIDLALWLFSLILAQACLLVLVYSMVMKETPNARIAVCVPVAVLLFNAIFMFGIVSPFVESMQMNTLGMPVLSIDLPLWLMLVLNFLLLMVIYGAFIGTRAGQTQLGFKSDELPSDPTPLSVIIITTVMSISQFLLYYLVWLAEWEGREEVASAAQAILA